MTIFNCSLEQLIYQLFQYVPMLKYLNVKYISKYNRSINNNDNTNKRNAVHLVKLIIGELKYNFEDFANFVKQIPNLTSLTISESNNLTKINAIYWEDLIKSSLPYLNIFKFKFGFKRRNNNEINLEMMPLFLCEFWIQDHDWYTQTVLEKYFATIYTIPYLSKK
ncbi:unnamed protein product [Rotaria magnacalcarata]|uniref:F-box domain-containing protein n=1 Tax=Rotaria magnacalcarata TaxID=392030 RepID=A0A816R132_9BILA|nr:unnamed protein product [Rotaria magnacalcarata]CAF1407746.1 unnamed protein product [Rotaria magnacalcarata]CAF2068782.1 unnamed protein product [Rotaria magnacalcarata]CAF2073223.1 unnamed protein product [Rotaria magnacalcarata]